MKFRKFIAVIMICFALFGYIPSEAFAFEAEEIRSGVMKPVLYDSPAAMQNSVSVLKHYTDTEEFRERVFSAVSECKETIDIYDLSIPFGISESVADFIWYHMPEAFNVYKIGFSYYEHDGVLSSVVVSYYSFADTKAEFAACFAQFMASADNMLKGIENNSNLTDVEKALLLHDRLALWTEYDYSSSDKKHTAYGAFAERLSVCQGYAMAYMYLLQRVGIENYYCSSASLRHGWNLVYIDGVPYHVDVTWDDRSWGTGTRGYTGGVFHNNFLRSTAGIKETGHTANDFDSSPVSTKYDSFFWQNSMTAFQLMGNEIYYIDNENAKLMRMSDRKVLCDVNSQWRSPMGVWAANFSCLSSIGGKLLFSLSDGVYKYVVETGSTQKIYAPSLSGSFSVFGFTYENGYIVCDINNTPNDAYALSQVKNEYSDASVVITGIEINTPPAKTFYTGDSADYSGLTLKVSYSDNSHSIITTGYTVSGFSSDTPGNKKLIVGYKNFIAELFVTINCRHTHKTEAPEISATCKSNGFTAGVYCEDCKSFISGHSEIPADAAAHKWNAGTVTTASTCIQNGIKTYICEYDSSHIKTENLGTDGNNHINKNSEAQAGYAAGAYCYDCKSFISGHVIYESDVVRASENKLIAIGGVKISEIMKESISDANIMNSEGKKLTADDVFVTGTVITFSDKIYYVTVLGDVNSDGKVTAADARLALRASVGLETIKEDDEKYKAADINGKGISASDARLILRMSVGLEEQKDLLKTYQFN